MSKYDSLQSHLMRSGRAMVPMSFADIERVLGRSLPASARRHRPWWSNNPGNNVMTKAWLAAGYKTESVDLGSERLVFRRAEGDGPPSGGASSGDGGRAPGKSIFGVLKGLLTVAPGADLTAPIGERWSADT